MTTRPLYTIANEIKKDWLKVSNAAKPYLEAMEGLNHVSDNYYMDSGSSVVSRFLCNANTWRGENARRIKAELKAMLKG